MNDLLKILRDYFPTAVFTGSALVFISQDARVELTQHAHGSLASDKLGVIRVRLFDKDDFGQFTQGHYEDFELDDVSDLAGEIEKFIQSAVGKNIRE